MNLYKNIIELWNGAEIQIIIEGRYRDTGEIILAYSDDMENSVASLSLKNAMELRDKLDEIIQLCEISR